MLRCKMNASNSFLQASVQTQSGTKVSSKKLLQNCLEEAELLLTAADMVSSKLSGFLRESGGIMEPGIQRIQTENNV
jgi:hypothetical protein